MQLVRSLIQLLEKGYSYRAISRELHISRITVTGYAAKLKNCNLTLSELRSLEDAVLAAIVYPPASPPLSQEDPRLKDFISRVSYFLSELNRTGVTRLLLWEEYRKQHPDGYGYTQFCVLLKTYRNTVNPSMTLEYKAGEMMMVDFAGDKMHYVDKSTGEVIQCPVLVCVLPYSGYGFVKALPNATIAEVINALNACLIFWGGVPLRFKTDNMRQVVSTVSRYEPVFTEAFRQWAIYYDIELLTTRVGRPKDKAPVENEVKIAYRRIYAPLRDEQFYSLSELNAAISRQLAIHHNKLFQRKDHSRVACFEKEEKHLLRALPADPFVLKHRVQAKVQRNYHITLGEDWHHYSVPYGYIGKTVTAVYDTDTVEVYYQFQRIAIHRRSYKKHGHTTVKEHMPQGHQNYFEQRGWTTDYFLKEAGKIGPSTHQYVQGVLKSKHFTEQTYNACVGILRLHKEYGADRLEDACVRALQGSTYTYRIVHNILKNNQDKQITAQVDLFKTLPHDNLRGPEAYQ